MERTMDDEELDAFGRTFAAFLERVVRRAPGRHHPLIQRLTTHLGVDPLGLPIVSAAFAPFEHPDVQLAVDGYISDVGRTSDAFGLSGGGRRHMDVSELLGTDHFAIGPVVRTEMPIDVDETMLCIEFGFVLVDGPADPPHVVVLRVEDVGPGPILQVDVISPQTGHANVVLDDLRTRMRSTACTAARCSPCRGHTTTTSAASGLRSCAGRRSNAMRSSCHLVCSSVSNGAQSTSTRSPRC